MAYLPSSYIRADIGLRVAFGVPAPMQRYTINNMVWSTGVLQAIEERNRLIKRTLRTKPEWPFNMQVLMSHNPVWGKGKVFNPRNWEGIGRIHLDRIFPREETHRSQTDLRLNRHELVERPKAKPTLFNRFFKGYKEIELIEDYETGGDKSLHEIQDTTKIYSDRKPYPQYHMPAAGDIKSKQDLEEYKNLFRGQISLMNRQDGVNIYRTVFNAARLSKPEYMNRIANFNKSNKNYFDDIDDPRTGWADTKVWQLNANMESKFQNIHFSIYDIRNDKHVLLPTSIRSVTENITPSWIEDEHFGRVDDIATYVKTAKEYNVDMIFSAQSPIDYLVMWRKIGLLESFQYPQYSPEGIRINPPIVRIRLGDFIRRGRGAQNGVAGYFRNFSIITDETMTIWELDNYELSMQHGSEVIATGPRYVEVSFNFKVLHDAEYTENEDGTVNFMHDAIYNDDGFASTKLNAAYKEAERGSSDKRIIITPLNNKDTEYDEADGTSTDQGSKGDFENADIGAAIS